MLVNYYPAKNSRSTLAMFGEYYKYHINVPVFYDQPLIPFYEYFYGRQRRLLYDQVQGIQQSEHSDQTEQSAEKNSILSFHSQSTLMLYRKLKGIGDKQSFKEPLLE